ncbi:hypothetical protein SCYAM73S_03863 [Streptomyces cyaneofuscatus]
MGEFEEEPRLRIEGAGLVLADTEVAGVESGGVVEQSAPALPGRCRTGPGVVPSPVRYGGDGVVPVDEQVPEGVGSVGAGEPARHPDDGR